MHKNHNSVCYYVCDGFLLIAEENDLQELRHEHETKIWFIEAERDQLREENRELNEFKASRV